MFNVTQKWWWRLTIYGCPFAFYRLWKSPFGVYRYCLHRQEWVFFLKRRLTVCGGVPFRCFQRKNRGKLFWVHCLFSWEGKENELGSILRNPNLC
jgi:hypothetical protein